MQKILILYIFLWIVMPFSPLFGQVAKQNPPIKPTSSVPWQEQILQLVDVEEIGEEAYNELLEELSDLTLWSDTLPDKYHRLKQQLILSSYRCLSPRAGFQDQTAERQQNNKAYLGDPWRQSIRFRLQQSNRWQTGLSLEKDPGEAWQNRFPGFDSWHAYVRYQQPAQATDVHRPRFFSLKEAILGHYRLRIGYGLTMNQSFSLGKQYFSQQISQRTNRIIPFASMAESDYMQGAALDFRLGRHLHVLPYFSIVQIDGNLSATDTLTTLYTDGMHRTMTEDRHRNAAWQMTMGTRIGWHGQWYELGAHVLNTQFQYPYVRKEMSHNHNYFRGQSLSQFSIDYQVRAFRNVLSGEFAIDDKAGFANLTSLQTHWNDSWQSALIYHFYSNDYQQLYGSSIGENSELQGEQGATLNLTGSLTKHWQLQAMADWTNFGQPQYQTKDIIPDDAYEGLLRAIYSRSWLTSSIGYRIKSKNENLRHSIDGIISIDANSHLSFKTQFRKRINDASTISHGYAIAQSLDYKSHLFKKVSLNMNIQAAYFDTDDYNSHIYLSEKNILYGFGFPMLYGKGIRYNLTCNLKIGSHWNIDLKYALSNYADQSKISSGLQEIKGNTQQDLWLQLRISY